MKKLFFTKCVLLLCPFFCQQLAAQTVAWQPNPVKQGQKTIISYQPKGGDLEFSDEPKAIVAVYSDFQWRSTPVALSKQNDSWTGSYQVPEQASFIALKFYQGDLENPEAIDIRNGNGYFTSILGKNGKLVPGAYLAEASLRAGLTGNMALNSFSKLSKDKRLVDSLLQKEEKLNKNIPDKLIFNYLDLKQLTMPVEAYNAFADSVLKNELKKKNVSEASLATLQRYFAKLKNNEGLEAVAALVFEKYPKSPTARFIAYRKNTEDKHGEDLEKGQEKFLEDFPYLEWKKSPDNMDYIYYTIFRGLATRYFSTGQNEKFLSLFKDIDFKTANEIYRWNLTRGHLLGIGDQKLLYRFSSTIIPYLAERQKDLSYLRDFDNDTLKAQQNADSEMDKRLFSHIFFAKGQEDYRNANESFKFLSTKGAYENASLNELHLDILAKFDDTKAIKEVLESSVSANAVTPKMFTKLKEIYRNEHSGKEDGYQQYLSNLMPEAKKTEMKAHVLANMVNYPLVPFSLENADGKMVNSKDWVNQIVVLDFWATWCRPCIEAFPGMQLLVDQYANDPRVGIYMIGTMQHGDYKSKSENYVRQQGFRFNLLHDAVGSKGNQDLVFKSLVPLFKSSAIPRKVIIKDGIVRYSSEGYSGSPSELRDEISMAVEILKAEK